MIQKVSELDHPPVIGKFYLVYCGLNKYSDEWTPLIGIAHDDQEIGINIIHYHQDVRFLSKKHEEDFKRYGERWNGYVTRLPTFAVRKMASIPQTGMFSFFAFKRRKCVREMPEMPRVRNFEILEEKFVGQKVKCGKCPHRGMPLESLPQVNGEVICNGHGLRIDMAKGEVIKR